MSAAVAAAAAAATVSSNSSSSQRRSNQAVNHRWMPFYSQQSTQPVLNRYESQKRRDWNAFRQFLNEHRPYSSLSRCSGVDVLEFLDDRFGDTKIHTQNCPFSEISDSPSSCTCSCPIKEAWSSLDGLVGRLRVAFEENGGRPNVNPFSAPVVRLYLSQLRDAQAQAKRIA